MKRIFCVCAALMLIFSSACAFNGTDDSSGGSLSYMSEDISSAASEEVSSSSAEESNESYTLPVIDLPAEFYDLGKYHSGGELSGALIYKAEGETLGSSIFAENAGITDLYIEDGVTVIEDGAFCGCTALVSIRLPSTLVKIERGAFKGCTALKAVYIPNSVTSIEEEAFENCAALSTVSLPSALTEIPARAFYGCASLCELKLPDSLLSIGSEAFKDTGISVIELPDCLCVSCPLFVEAVFVTKSSAAHTSAAAADPDLVICFK